jgi:hypothetical protein
MIRGRMTALTIAWTLGIAGLLLIGGGCAEQPYYSGYTFNPQPAVVQVFQRGDTKAPVATVLVSIIGIRRADTDQHRPPSIDLRLRFENNGQVPLSFDPASLDLVTGTLFPFSRPMVSPPTPIDLAPGQRAEASASFPFPPNTTPDRLNLNNLRLRWVVRVSNYPVSQTALFERVAAGYAPTYGPAPEAYNSDVAY